MPFVQPPTCDGMNSEFDLWAPRPTQGSVVSNWCETYNPAGYALAMDVYLWNFALSTRTLTRTLNEHIFVRESENRQGRWNGFGGRGSSRTHQSVATQSMVTGRYQLKR